VDPGRLELGRRRSARSEHAPRALLRHPAVVVDESEETDAEASREQRGEADEVTPRAALLDRDVERILDRPDAVLEHVEEQEEKDARGRSTEERAERGARAVQTADRQPDEDRRAGHRAQQQDLTGAHVRRTLQASVDVRQPLHARDVVYSRAVAGHSVDDY